MTHVITRRAFFRRLSGPVVVGIVPIGRTRGSRGPSFINRLWASSGDRVVIITNLPGGRNVREAPPGDRVSFVFWPSAETAKRRRSTGVEGSRCHH